VNRASPVVSSEVAGIGLRETRSAGRQYVLQAVDHVDTDGLIAEVLQLALSRETVLVAGHPGVAKSEL
jgi:MoxR-like ATPase